MREQLNHVFQESQSIKKEIDALQEGYKIDEAELSEVKTKIVSVFQMKKDTF